MDLLNEKGFFKIIRECTNIYYIYISTKYFVIKRGVFNAL